MNARPNFTAAALIVAAGRGVRAGSDGLPKQYQLIGGRPVLNYSLETFLGHPAINTIQIVIGVDDAEHYGSFVHPSDRLRPPVVGAETRQGSVFAGLTALSEKNPPDRVLIHDAARPFVTRELTSRVVNGLDEADAVVPTLPIASTVKSIDEAGKVAATVPREGLHTAQTPQGFNFSTILAAHRKAASEGRDFTDDAALAEWAGVPVLAIPGETGNDKLTTAGDIAMADRQIAGEAMLARGDIRVGTGYDVHAFGPGSEVILGGIAIPHTHALIGHSDADVGLHAITDAILGALGDGDIGAHFPPSDPKWENVSSDHFLAEAARKVEARGGAIAHLDLTIIAEFPKIGPHREAIRHRIAQICRISIERVGVKATTTEGLGFLGRCEGIAAQASATLRLPESSPL